MIDKYSKYVSQYMKHQLFMSFKKMDYENDVYNIPIHKLTISEHSREKIGNLVESYMLFKIYISKEEFKVVKQVFKKRLEKGYLASTGYDFLEFYIFRINFSSDFTDGFIFKIAGKFVDQEEINGKEYIVLQTISSWKAVEHITNFSEILKTLIPTKRIKFTTRINIDYELSKLIK